MSYVVPRHTASPRTSSGPRNIVPQATGRAHAHRRDAQPSVRAPAHGRCSGAWSVLRRIVRALAQCPCPVPCRCRGPWPGRKRMVGAQAHGQYSGAWSVRKRIARAHASCRCSGPWSMPTPMVRARCRVDTPAHGRCSDLLWVLRPLVVTAHGRCAQPRHALQVRAGLAGQSPACGQTEGSGRKKTGQGPQASRGARPGPTKHCT